MDYLDKDNFPICSGFYYNNGRIYYISIHDSPLVACSGLNNLREPLTPILSKQFSRITAIENEIPWIISKLSKQDRNNILSKLERN